MQILLAILLITALIILVVGGVLNGSQEGYEDESGYHSGHEHRK
jgi:hypothetical protein